MQTFYPRKTFSKVLLVLSLFALPQIAPPSGNGDDAVLNLGPKAAEAQFLTQDIAQVFGHIGNFGQMLDQIGQLRKQYQTIRDNFKKIGGIASALGFDLKIDDFFAPIDKVVNDNFDKAFAIASLSENTWDSLTRKYGNISSGDAASSASEQLRDAGKFTKKLATDFVKEPKAANKKLTMLQKRVEASQDCMQAAKGNLQVSSCMQSMQAAGVKSLGRLEAAVAKQTALLAQGKANTINARVARERLRIMVTEENEAGTNTHFNQFGAQYKQVGGLSEINVEE